MRRSSIVIIIGIIVVVNLAVLFFLIPRLAKPVPSGPTQTAASPVPNSATTAAAPIAISSITPAGNPTMAVAATTVSTAAMITPAADTVAASAPAQVAHAHPTAPPVQAGMHLERQTVTASGNLRVQYLRDRQQGMREIVLQDAHDPANSHILVQYTGNAWIVASPNDEWIALNKRNDGEAAAELYHRVSAKPLNYEIPQANSADGSALQEVVWKNYLAETQQDPAPDRSRLTIDATTWDPDSQRLTLAVTPKPIKDGAAPQLPWTCTYNVTTNQIETPEVAEGPNDSNNSAAAPNESQEAPAGAVVNNETTPTEAAPAEPGTDDLEGEKYPATRQDKLTVADANELSLNDVRYAINEMFARHGASFKDAKPKHTFSQFSWYQPRQDATFDEIEAEFSDLEKQNLAVLRRARDAKVKSAARHAGKSIRGEQVDEESEGQKFLRNVLQGVSDQMNGNGN